jgi:outer membrane protein
MKKLLFASVLLTFMATAASAQFFVGGSVGFSHSGGSIDDGTNEVDKVSTNNFEFAPKVGYELSEDLEVGVELGFFLDRTNSNGAPEIIGKESGIALVPFARYYAITMNKFALGLEGRMGLGISSQKTEAGGTTTDGPKTTSLSLNVAPGLFYHMSDRVTLEAVLGGLSLGYAYNVQKTEAAGVTTKNRSNSFGLGADLDNIFTTGAITVGAVIRF